MTIPRKPKRKGKFVCTCGSSEFNLELLEGYYDPRMVDLADVGLKATCAKCATTSEVLFTLTTVSNVGTEVEGRPDEYHKIYLDPDPKGALP